jgi:hypothetical protein
MCGLGHPEDQMDMLDANANMQSARKLFRTLCKAQYYHFESYYIPKSLLSNRLL